MGMPSSSVGRPVKGEEDSRCPVMHNNVNLAAGMDMSTNMPNEQVLQDPSTSSAAATLDTSREPSSIPRTDPSSAPSPQSTWTYPSQRMFFNALHRKGKETDPRDVESMLAVHNWLNESVWDEILKWEHPHKPSCPCGPTLKRFMGRPADLSPRAWFYTHILRGPAPFDRHDWTVDRCGNEVRYIIDYYGAGREEGSGMPVFSVDVRPALDTVQAVFDRFRMAWQNKFQ